MHISVEPIDIGTKRPVVLLNSADAETLGVHALDRVEISWDGNTEVGIVKITDELVGEGTLGVTHGLPRPPTDVDVTAAPHPSSVESIKRKLDDEELDADELEAIVADIYDDRLSDLELSAYICGAHTNGFSLEETKTLTERMSAVGERLDWDQPVIADKHSVGGVAGNRVTPIIIPIAVAAGLTVPKTSSRAVTSPAGTADTMEVFCSVEFSLSEIRDIVEDVGGCLVWGGAVDLSPVDDKMIRAQNPLSVNPPGQTIASVLSKKQSAGSSHIIIDVPYGEGAKVTNLDAARELATDFKRVGDYLDLHVECAITRGTDPIGHGIGPVLEARDVLAVLEGDGPAGLRLKSLRLADILLDITREDGADIADVSAAELLDSGAALETFREIIAAQGGDPDVSRADLQPADRTETVVAGRDGIVTDVANPKVSELARRAGAPADVGAGLELHRSTGDTVAAGDELYTIHAEAETKLGYAREYAAENTIVRVGGRDEALIERV
jgi:AMP phosphorylase